MFQLTEQAAQELKKLKDAMQEKQLGGVLRLFGSGEGEFKLAVDSPEEGDQELYCADEKVLVVSPEISGVLTNVTLDCKDTPEGRRLVFEERVE